MSVQERIAKIKEYFIGMQVENIGGENIIYVMVQFPPKWLIIDEEEQNKYNVSIIQSDNGINQYIFCTSIENGFDCVFDAIDENISKMLIILERTKLLKEKVEQLKALFENEEISIESLRTLEFKYKQPKIKKTIKNTVVQPIDEYEEQTEESEIVQE